MVCTHLPRTSALARSVHGTDAEWGLMEHFGAVITDGINQLGWLQSRDGQTGRNRPKPIERPGARPKTEKTAGTRMSLEEADDWLGWNKN